MKIALILTILLAGILGAQITDKQKLEYFKARAIAAERVAQVAAAQAAIDKQQGAEFEALKAATEALLKACPAGVQETKDHDLECNKAKEPTK